MSETYDQIVEEIKFYDYSGASNDYMQKHDCERGDTRYSDTDMMLDVAARVREAVGGDPAEWWVEDAAGNRVQIGDFVIAGGNRLRVIGFYSDGFVTEDDDGDLARDHKDRAIKVIPDTREKIIENTLATLELCCVITPTVKEAVEKAVDSAMKLAEVDA